MLILWWTPLSRAFRLTDPRDAAFSSNKAASGLMEQAEAFFSQGKSD